MYIDDWCLSNKITKKIILIKINDCTSLLKEKKEHLASQLAIRVLQCVPRLLSSPKSQIPREEGNAFVHTDRVKICCLSVFVSFWVELVGQAEPTKSPNNRRDPPFFNHGYQCGCATISLQANSLVTTLINLLGSRFLLFTMCSHSILKGFSSSSQCVSQDVSNSITLQLNFRVCKL